MCWDINLHFQVKWDVLENQNFMYFMWLGRRMPAALRVAVSSCAMRTLMYFANFLTAYLPLPSLTIIMFPIAMICHDTSSYHFNTLKNLQPISRGFATRPAHTADQYSGCILAKGALVSDLAMRMALVMSCAFLLFYTAETGDYMWLLFQQPSAHMFRNEEVDLLQDSLRKANWCMSSPQICMFRVQFCGLQPVTASCWSVYWSVYSNSCNENSRNISVGAATTKSFAQLLTLAQSAGSIILHLSVHAIGLVHWVFVTQGRCGWDTGGCGSDLHLTIPDLRNSLFKCWGCECRVQCRYCFREWFWGRAYPLSSTIGGAAGKWRATWIYLAGGARCHGLCVLWPWTEATWGAILRVYQRMLLWLLTQHAAIDSNPFYSIHNLRISLDPVHPSPIGNKTGEPAPLQVSSCFMSRTASRIWAPGKHCGSIGRSRMPPCHCNPWQLREQLLF